MFHKPSYITYRIFKMRVEWVAMDKWRLATVMVVLAVALAALAVAVVADA